MNNLSDFLPYGGLKIKKQRRDYLQRAARNNYGYVDVTPGTDMANRLSHVSESTIRKYIREGWLRKVGSGLVLTRNGYTHI